MAQPRLGALTRPHPAFWHFVFLAGSLYATCMVVFSLQSLGSARLFMKNLDSRLGVPLPERDYAAEGTCALTVENLWGCVNDEFILAHILGHFGKAIIVRSWGLGWVVSVGFEWLELSFQHILMNFKECWWDHVIIDIFLCNAIGLWLGLKACEWSGSRLFNWLFMVRFRSPLKWFIPNRDERIQFNSYFVITVVQLTFVIVDMNSFILKALLWLPPPHPLNTMRLILWGLIGIAGCRDWFRLHHEKGVTRLGRFAWLIIACVVAELFVVINLGRQDAFLSNPEVLRPPTYIFYPWLLFFTTFFVWSAMYFPTEKFRIRNQWYDNLVKVVCLSMVVPLLYIFVAACPDLQWGQEIADNVHDALALY